jgi:hypothetical protein
VTVEDRAFRPSYGRWQARILDAGGDVRGSGVLISDRHVLTCAHVLSDDEAHPAHSFTVDFPRSGDTVAAPARVIPGGWFPEAASRRDIAILEIGRPPPADVEPARLGRWEGTRGNPAIVFGHPEGLDEGLWTETRIVDSVGERIQLTSSSNGLPERIEPGYSGGGVIEAASGRVVGIVVTSFLSADRIVAFMIPMEAVAGYWQSVASMMDGPHADDLLTDAALGELALVFGSVRELAAEKNRIWIAERLPEEARIRLTGPSPSVRGLVQACRRRAEMRALADLVRYRDTEALVTGTLEDRLRSHRVLEVMPGAEQPQHLGTGARHDLHRILLHQPAFGSRTTRSALMEELGHQLGMEARLAATGSASDDAWALIDAVQSITGALRRMLAYFPRGPEFDQLETLVDLLSPYRLLTDQERDELVRLLEGIPPEPLGEARRHADTPAADAGPSDVMSLVRAIEEQSQVGALPRIFTFTECVAVRFPERASELQIWGDRCAARQHLRFRDLADLRARTATVVSGPADVAPALVIQMAPDALRPTELFQLSAALQRSGQPQYVLTNSNDAEPLEVIRTRVDTLFGEVYRELGYEPETLTVEVVLPRALLTEAVDQWDLTDLLPVPIGSRFVVVLRSYERLRQDRLWPSWRHKWRLAQDQKAPRADVIYYLAPDDRSGPVDIAARLRPDHKLALVCGRPLARQPDLKPHDAYVAALAAGVAYVAWIREVALADDFRVAVEEALAEVPVRDLPRRIADWRSVHKDYGGQPAAAIAAHVSVLACDYDRKVQFSKGVLKSPSRREQP